MAVVLLVEDDADLRSILLQSLPYFGQFAVVGAADGIAGLEQCLEMHPDCLIIDVKMPGLDGYQLVRALRGDPQTESIPLIILTALAQDQDRFTGLAAGADRFLQKPIKPQELARIVEDVLRIDAIERAQHYAGLAQQEEHGHE
ncbi:MAG: response regulator [Ktedonobacterales bacterium]|nr:response regulator [Ktedonobacterales bacterium]